MAVFGSKEVKSELDKKLAARLEIMTKDITGSTNDDVKKLGASGAPEGTVIIAGAQTAGKGRLGRSFWSPENSGLYMSVLLRPEMSADDALTITTAAAVAVAEAIEELNDVNAGIKWVNDVYIAEKKVCGILTESSLSPDGSVNFAVLGIGINVSESVFPDDIKDKAGSIGLESGTRPKLAAAVLTHFFGYYDLLPSKDYMDEYRRRSILDGKTVCYTIGGKEYSGTVTGIDNSAELLVRSDDGIIRRLSSGEVSVKIH